MKLMKLTIRNFMSIKKAELKLDEAGLVLVQGVNDDDAAFDSNGAGKSTVFEAITYALFEKTIRGLKTDEIINEDVKRNCSVILELEDGDVKYEIKRYRKHKDHKNNTIVTRAGVNVSGKSSKDSNLYIEKLIGMDFSTFTNSILFGQGVVKLFSMATDKEKKDILENMLSMDVFNTALDITKERLKTATNNLQASEMKTNEINAKLDSANETLEYFEGLQRTHQSETQATIEELERDKARINRELSETDSSEQYKRLIESVDEKLGELSNTRTQVESQLAEKDKLQESLNKYKSDYHFAKNGIAHETEKLTSLKQENDDLEAGVGTNCPTCGSEITKDGIEDALSALLEKMRVSVEKIDNYETNLTTLNNEIKDVSSELANFNKLEQSLKTIDSEVSAYRDNRSQLNAQLTIINARRNSLEDELASLDKKIEKEKSELNKGFTDNIETQRNLVKTHTESLTTLEAEKTQLKETISQLKFWVDGFGNSGIKSYLLDSVTPYLNTRANHYLSKLAGSTTEIKFSTQTRLKSGEVRDKFEVQINNQVGGTSYGSNSTGERKRIDLAISLALQDLVMTRSNGKFNILLYDEVFDGLDAVGCENAIQLLKEIQEGVPSVFVITHNDVLKSYFDNTLTVTKRNGETVVSEIQ